MALHPLHCHAHRACASHDDAHGSVKAGGVEVLDFFFGDLIRAVGVDADAPHVGDDAPVHDWHINRIDSHWPHVGSDIEVGDIPASTGVTQVAVSFTKGCYPGQELVERMDSRGSNAPVALRVLSAGEYRAGETVQDNGVDIGTITSVGRVHAIARIKRGHDAGTALSL